MGKNSFMIYRKIAWAIAGIGVSLVTFGKSGVSDVTLGIAVLCGAILGISYSILLEKFNTQTNRIVWLTISFSTLFFIFFGRDGKLISYYGVILFSFPISLIVDGINYLTFRDPINDFLGLFWLAAFILGYFQWFVFLPRIKRSKKMKDVSR